MKTKLLFMLLLIALFQSAAWSKKRPHNRTEKPRFNISPFTIEEGTLNGYSLAQANDMMKLFNNVDRKSFTDKTNVWYCKDFIDYLYTALVYEGADGVRFYFTKKLGSSDITKPQNTILMVSTYQIIRNDSLIHQDYFTHSKSILDYIKQAIKTSKEDYGTDVGARLYRNRPCFLSGCNTPSTSTVDCQEAHRRVTEFKNERIDAISVWYKISVIKRLWNELHAGEARKKKSDGVRIYFCKNGHKQGFVITTTRNQRGIHRDYYKCYNPIVTGETTARGHHNPFTSDDNGEQCPEACGGTTWGDNNGSRATKKL